MPVSGFKRYQRLFKNIVNWQEYVFHKGERKNRSLTFTTRPIPITFKVPETLYQVFKEIFMEDFYEIEELVNRLPATPVIIDIGANAGFFNILLFSKIKNAQAIAYEPMLCNILLFKDAIAENPVLQTIQLHQIAVTGLPKGHVELFTAETNEHTVVSSVFSEFNVLNNNKIFVPAQSLASIIKENKLDKIDLLKLDCEGSEYDIIYNTEPSILRKVKMMVIEVHQIDNERNNIQALNDYLESIGYTTRHLPVQEGSFYLEAIGK